MKDTLKTRLTVALTAACLLGAALLQPRLLAMRTELNPSVATLEKAPPLIAFTTVALGGLRGVLIDVLWARITTLQDREDYMEIVQLADWITKLEPRLAIVWDYHSFNMAYNISRMCPDPKSRWRWVNSGIKLLRDEAIVYNPRYLALYDRLCRIYQHKLVSRADPGNEYYRLQLAKEMSAALGDADISNPTPNPALAARLAQYRMDPGLMRELDSLYGPFDWRLPDSQVLYWASIGKQQAGGSVDAGFDFFICQAVSQSALDGRMVAFDPDSGTLTTGPNHALVAKAVNLFDATLARHGLAASDNSAALAAMYLEFMKEELILAAREGRQQDAQDIFSIIKNKLRDPTSDRPLEEYLAAIQIKS